MSVLGAGEAFMLASGEDAGFAIKRSLRFNAADTPELTRVPSTAGNTKTFTISFWAKRGKLSSTQMIVQTGDTYANLFRAYWDGNDNFRFHQYNGSYVMSYITSAQYRDVGAWYHFVIAIDTTQAVAANRAKLYVNGVEVTDWTTESHPAQDLTIGWNAAIKQRIGREYTTTYGNYYNYGGYLAEFHSVDGLQLAPTDFGEFSQDTGEWNPIKYTGSHNSAAGVNYSSQTITNENSGYTTDKMFDGVYGSSASLNNSVIANETNGTYSVYTFANPISYSSSVRIYGDLDTRSTDPDIKANSTSVTGFSDNTGLDGSNKKWYTVLSGSGTLSTVSLNQHSGYVAAIYAIEVDGTVLVSSTAPAGVNGFHLDFSDNSSNAALGYDAAGSNNWTVSNLSADAPGLSTANQGFNAVTWTGDGSNSRAIDVGFQPDFLWIKRRDANQHHYLWDSIRGVTKEIHSDLDYAEGTATNKLASFDSNGFTVKNHVGVNQNGNTYVAWAWKAGGSSVSNTNGTITSSVSVNNTYGFSVVTYTGNSTAGATVGHGLSTAPSLIYIKNRSRAANWAVGHSGVNGFANGNQLRLNTTGNLASSEEWFNDTSPTSSVFTVKNNYEVNYSNDNYVAYCWSEVSGFSKFGAYAGNSDNSNVTNRVIDCGFKPKYVLIKCSSNSGEEWMIFDGARNTSNPRNLFLKAESANGDGSYAARHISFVDNGFKFEGSNGQEPLNLSGRNYIFAAFADVPDGSIIDSLIDTPTNYEQGANIGGNYCTLNPLAAVRASISDGNLTASSTSSYAEIASSIAMLSGKWYCEFTLADNAGEYLTWGVSQTNRNFAVGSGVTDNPEDYGFKAWPSGFRAQNNGQNTHNYNSSISEGDVFSLAFDADAGKFWCAVNGTWLTNASGVGNPATGANPDHSNLTYSGGYYFMFGPYNGGSSNIINVNFGQRGSFTYQPPTGYKALCTQNFDDPLIADPSAVFDTVLYNGDGQSTQTVSGLSFNPDLIWNKNRSTGHHNRVFDVVRGFSKFLASDHNGAEDFVTDYGYITATSGTGFTVGQGTHSGNLINHSAGSYVNWCWDAGTSNTTVAVDANGSGLPGAACEYRANTTAGFSIVKVANPTNTQARVHGLNKKPDLIICKSTASADSWHTYHSSFGYTKYINLNDSGGFNTSDQFGSQEPTSTYFYVKPNTGSGANKSGGMVYYIWTAVEGYSAFGAYEGNGSSDGAFVYTGFRPAWIMVKNADGTGHWVIMDSKRDVDNQMEDRLKADAADAESNTPAWDALSNGFKIRSTYSFSNSNNNTYIYAAFAENPFKTARAR